MTKLFCLWRAFLVFVAAAMSCSVALATGPAVGTWGFDTTGMDRSVKPGDDFHRFANGVWVERTSIPDDRSKFTVFSDLDDRVQGQLQALLTEMAADRTAPPGSNRQILGDWFASLKFRHSRSPADAEDIPAPQKFFEKMQKKT